MTDHQPGQTITLEIPNLSYFRRFVYTFSGTLPAIIGVILHTKGFKTVTDLFEKTELTNFWSIAVLLLAFSAFIFFLHFIAKKIYTEDGIYPMVSAATFSSGYGVILSGAGFFS